MNIEIVDQIPSAIEGAPAKMIGLREDGAFGLLKTPSVAQLKPTPALDRALMLGETIDRARAIVSGSPRATTEPGATRDMAVAVLAVSAQLGRLAMIIDELHEKVAALTAAEGEAAGAEEKADV